MENISSIGGIVVFTISIISIMFILGKRSSRKSSDATKKVRLFELEKMLKAYTDTPASIESLTIRSVVLIEGLEFYVEGTTHLLHLTPKLVAYKNGIEFLRVSRYYTIPTTVDPALAKVLSDLCVKHKLSSLGEYLLWSLKEGKDYYTLSDFRDSLLSSKKLTINSNEYPIIGKPVDLKLVESGFELKLVGYTETIKIPKNAVIRLDAKDYNLRHLFMRLDDGVL